MTDDGTGVFDFMPGFVAILRGPEHVFDYTNDAYRALAGPREYLGRSVREVFPELAGQGFYELLDSVYATGTAIATRGIPVVLDQEGGDIVVDVQYSPTRDKAGRVNGIFVAGYDVTDAHRGQERWRVLAELSDGIRDLTNPEDLVYVAAEILGSALGVTRVGFGSIDDDDVLHIDRDWNAPGIVSLTGLTPLRDYGSFADNLRRGETVIIADTSKDPRTATAADAILAKGARSFVNVPIIEHGRLVAMLLVNHIDPRLWRDEEVTLIREVADRVRTGVQRLRNENELRASEALYAGLFDAIDQGFCIIEFFDGPHGPLSDYIHVEANEAYARHAGIPNVVGQKLREMVPDEADDWVARYGEVLRTGEQIRFEQELIATGRYLELSAVRIEPPSRRQVAVLFQDITARKRAEVALRGNEARLRFLDTLARQTSASDDADDILAITTRAVANHLAVSNCAYADMDDDQDGFTIRGDWAAPGSPSIVGHYSLADFGVLAVRNLTAGQPLVINDNLRELAPHEAKTFQDIGIAATICMPLVKDGRLTALMAIHDKVPHDWTDQELALIREVTERSWAHVERVRSEAALRASAGSLADLNATLEQQVDLRTAELMAAEESLRQSQKMEAVGQLTGGLAHDFNNILAGIGGSLEMMSTRLAQGRIGDLDRYITGASGAAKRAAGLTQRLLAFSRRQTLDPKPTNLNNLVNGMLDLVTRSVGPGIEVETAGAAGLWTTFVDAGQLENALLNLCINARDAMPDGGKLTIETSNRWMDDRAARERGLTPGQYISLCVSDTGTGMTPEVIARAFDPFFTTKPIGQGTGLGLSMVYGFAGQSGGAVRIYSEIDKGSMVCIYLPRFSGDADADDAGLGLSAEAPRADGGETILVVDDEPLVRMIATEQLEELGYMVLEAGDGPSALKILNSNRPIHLLITDVGLPSGMNGRQLADAARVTRPGLEVLFITGYAENAVLNHGHLDPGMHVMTKPFQMDIFARRVKDLIAKEQR